MKLKVSERLFVTTLAAVGFGSFALAGMLYYLGFHDYAVPIGLAVGTTAAGAMGWYWVE